MQDQITIWDHLAAWLSAAALWFGGESGRIFIASGFGGLVRWFGDEKRRIRTGILSWAGGAITGFYLWPIALKAPMIFGLSEFDRSPEHVAMAGFLVGAFGVSAVKIIIAVVEARAKKYAGGDDA